MTDCRRTPGVIDRVVADEVTVDDRAHAATCASCGPVLERAARFDAELARATHRFVAEDLPAGVLGPGLAGQVDRVRPGRGLSLGLASAAAAVAILVLALAVALAPPMPPGATPSPKPPPGPVFKTTIGIVAHVVALDYTCNDGQPLPTSGPSAGLAVRESAVCHTPQDLAPFIAAIIVGESAQGEVVSVWMKSNVTGSDSPESRQRIAQTLAKLTLLSLGDPGTGSAAGDFVAGRLPGLAGAATVSTETGGVSLLLERREDGLYVLTLEPAPAG